MIHWVAQLPRHFDHRAPESGAVAQMVWPTTTRVGCAIFSADWDYLICRYSPPNNKDGKPVFVTASAQATAARGRN